MSPNDYYSRLIEALFEDSIIDKEKMITLQNAMKGSERIKQTAIKIINKHNRERKKVQLRALCELW